MVIWSLMRFLGCTLTVLGSNARESGSDWFHRRCGHLDLLSPLPAEEARLQIGLLGAWSSPDSAVC